MLVDTRVAAVRSLSNVKWGWLAGAKSALIHGFVVVNDTLQTVGKCDGRTMLKEVANGEYCERCIRAALKRGDNK